MGALALQYGERSGAGADKKKKNKIPFLASPLHVTPGKLLNLSEPQFPHV